jgi:hypothetical protein
MIIRQVNIMVLFVDSYLALARSDYQKTEKRPCHNVQVNVKSFVTQLVLFSVSNKDIQNLNFLFSNHRIIIK